MKVRDLKRRRCHWVLPRKPRGAKARQRAGLKAMMKATERLGLYEDDWLQVRWRGRPGLDEAALSRETGVSVPVLRTLAGIFDPANAHLFTAESARRALSRVKPKPER